MHTFITIFFWMSIIDMILLLIILSISQYPYTRKITLGMDIAKFLSYLCIAIWAALLLFSK